MVISQGHNRVIFFGGGIFCRIGLPYGFREIIEYQTLHKRALEGLPNNGQACGLPCRNS